jgi:DNA polymerase
MLVGEAWGQWEEREKRPFVGPAGRMLNELLLKSGIDPDACYFTNIVNARPPANDLGEWIPGGYPNEVVVDSLAQLRSEIQRIQPNVVVPLGNWPLWAFYGLPVTKKKNPKTHKPSWSPSGILDYRGYLLEARKLTPSQKIVPTVHPSYLLQGGYSDSPFAILDLQRARSESTFPEIRRRPRELVIDPRGEDRRRVRDRLLSEGQWIVLDIEYIGAKLLCIGFSTGAGFAATIVIRNPDDLAWCRSIIESGRPLCAQNAMFDLGILAWHHKINAFKYLAFDTMVAAYNINIEARKDLGMLGSIYTDLPAWWDVIDWDKIKSGQQDIETIWEYNAIDCCSCYEIAEKQLPELQSDPKMWEAFQFDMAKLEPLWNMACRGVPIDFEQFKRIKLDAKSKIAEAQTALNFIADAAGMPLHGTDFNVKSPIAVPQLLFLYLGLPDEGKTPLGTYFRSDNVALLEAMRKTDNELAKRAIKYIAQAREGRDIDSKTLEIDWDSDGRARCIYDATKTTTRRLSSKVFFPTGKGANLQNIPAPGSSSYGEAIRSAFRCDPGYEFGYSDLKGAEFLVVAEITQDAEMLRFARMTLEGTGDVHRETGAFIFTRIRGRPIDPMSLAKDSIERFLGKKTRHSGNYMVGWKELMGRINAEAMETGVFVTAAMMKQILEAYHELHPGLRIWYREVETELRQNGLLRNLFGFPRRFLGRIDQILPAAVAFVPQSTIGDCLNYGLLACDRDEHLRDAGFQLLLNVHDAIGFQYPKQNRDEVLPRVNQLMSVPVRIPKTGKDLNIPVEIAVGPNWGNLEAVHV